VRQDDGGPSGSRSRVAIGLLRPGLVVRQASPAPWEAAAHQQNRTVLAAAAAALADERVVGDLWAKFEEQGVEERHSVNAGDRPLHAIADENYQRCASGALLLATLAPNPPTGGG